MTSLNDCNALCELLVKTIASGKFEAQKPEFDRTAFVTDELKKIGCFVETKIIEDTPNVIAYFGNKNAKKSICFCGHCDVVPVFNNWSKNYKGEIVGDRVYGRGAVDMLGGVVCWMYALQQLSPDILERVKIATILTGDEEGYGTNGIIKFADYLRQQGELFDACIVGEPTSEYAYNFDGDLDKEKLYALSYSRSGSYHFTITIKGKSGHIAYFDEFDNPIYKASRLCLALKDIKFDGATNLEVYGFNGVNATDNVVLENVALEVNVRFDAKYGKDIVKQKVIDTCKKVLGDSAFDIKDECSRLGFSSDIESDFCQLAMGVMKKYNENSMFVKSKACTDAEYMTKICKSVCEIGLKCKTMHKPNEYTTKQDLQQLMYIYRDIITEFALNYNADIKSITINY